MGRHARSTARRRFSSLTGPLVAAVSLLAACTTPPSGSAACSTAWSQVALPTGITPSSVTASGSVVAVGGSAPAGEAREPRLVSIDGATTTEIPLAAKSSYGRLAQLVFLATDGVGIAAVGTATGGAHLNPRWTVWRGTTDLLVEEPQPMETFGGWDAGSLSGLTLDAVGPLLVGSWSTGSGTIAGALWTTSGATWARDPRGSALAGSAADPALPTGIATRGSQALVSGFVSDPANGVLHATLWVGDRSNGWHAVALPGAATDSVATAVACEGESCWVAGRVGSILTLWQVTEATAVQVPDVPQMPVAPASQTPRLAVSQDLLWVGIDGSDQRAAIMRDGAWAVTESPGRDITAVATTGDRVFAVVDDADSRLLVSCLG